MARKGFPESYDGTSLIRFLAAVKAGKHNVTAPVYSHLTYDIVPGETIVVDRPDILIVEGINVLLPNRLPREGQEIPFVSDFFDFSVFLDADEALLEKWYVERFMGLRTDGVPRSAQLFPQFADIDDAEAEATARSIWRGINLVNLHENILPTRPRAGLLLTKGASHRIEEVALAQAVRPRCRRVARRRGVASQPSDSHVRAAKTPAACPADAHVDGLAAARRPAPTISSTPMACCGASRARLWRPPIFSARSIRPTIRAPESPAARPS